MVENALEATSMNVPSAGQATALPSEWEKNTKDAETNLQKQLIDLLGIEVVEQYHSKKLLFDKYCDKMLKIRKSSKIIKCDVLTQKGPISLKVYREDRLSEVIKNLKVSDLYLAEWREVVQACPDRREKAWKTIYGLIKTRMEYLEQTEKELNIDFSKPLKEQDPLNELNELANKNRRRTSDLKDYSSLWSGIETEEGPWLELQFSLVDNSKLNVGVCFTCKAMITTVRENMEWHYISCSRCTKKVTEQNEEYDYKDHRQQDPPIHRIGRQVQTSEPTPDTYYDISYLLHIKDQENLPLTTSWTCIQQLKDQVALPKS
ncbi:hypothetical protein Tco_0738832 [Tanacetum coccineum]